jgi:hypothetical protein
MADKLTDNKDENNSTKKMRKNCTSMMKRSKSVIP